MQERPSLTNEERAELERLRGEVTTLRSQVTSQLRPAAEAVEGGGAGAGRIRRQRWRAPVAVVLIVVACLLAPLSVVAVWTRNLVTNTDRYVQTVAPLAKNPGIQNAVADQITAQIFTQVDVTGLTTQAADALDTRGLPRAAEGLRALAGPIASGVQSFARTQVGKVVQSDAFANAWVQANRIAHAELNKALTGQGGAITVADDTVRVNLAPITETVKRQLTAAGFSLADRIPEVNASLVLFQSNDLPKVQSGFRLLNTLGDWLPVIVLVLIAVGVYVARGHRRALLGAALGVAAGMVVLALALALLRSAYLGAIPSQVVPHDAAAAAYDTIVRFLRAGLRTVLVLGLVVAAGAFLTGSSVTAVRARAGWRRALAWLRGSTGLRTGPVGTWMSGNKRPLQIGAVALAGVTLVFWGRPTGKVVIGLAVLLLVVLAVIELLGQPPERTASALE
jgi:hypothetical protein